MHYNYYRWDQKSIFLCSMLGLAVVGPFIAPIVGFGFGTAFDQFWHGEDIFGIDGFSLNPGGKSIDKWIKDFLTELFGG